MAASRACSRFIGPFLGAILTAQVPTVLDVSNPAVNPGQPGLTADVSGFAFSDPVSLKAFGERWQGPFTPRKGEQGLLGSFKAALTYRKEGSEVGLWHQQRILMVSNKDTVEFLRTTKSREELPIGRTYDLEMAVNGIQRTGLTLSQSWILVASSSLTWSVGVGGKGWYANQGQSGLIRGAATATGSKTYDFNLTVDYRYTKNLLYDLPVPSSAGAGFGGLLGTELQGEGWSLQAAADDLGSRTWWKALPFTNADAKSQRQHYDSSGYLKFDPTIEGIEGEKDWVQRTPTAWMTRASWNRGSWRLGARVERISNFTFYAWEGSFQWTETDRMQLTYEPRTRSWGLGWAGKQARVGIAIQSWDISRSRSLGLSLGWSYGHPFQK